MRNVTSPICCMLRHAPKSIVIGVLICACRFGTAANAGPSAAGRPSTPERYSVQDLGVLPLIGVADETIRIGINDDGAISYWTDGPASSSIDACLWDHGVNHDLGRLPDCSNSVTFALNNKDEVVGWSVAGATMVGSDSFKRAFVYQSGCMQYLGSLGGKDSQALAISDNGDIVGKSLTYAAVDHAFLYRAAHMTDLGTLPGGTYSAAYGVNRHGDIVGESNIPGRLDTLGTTAGTNGQPVRRAVLWHDGKIQDLHVNPGMDSVARSINRRGQIVGYMDTRAAGPNRTTTSGGFHAFLYDHRRTTDLGTLGSDPSVAIDINDAGQIVGWFCFHGPVFHAFIWQDGAMRDLSRLVPSDSGWNITRAYSINGSGQVTCIGRRPGGATHALLLTPVSGPR